MRLHVPRHIVHLALALRPEDIKSSNFSESLRVSSSTLKPAVSSSLPLSLKPLLNIMIVPPNARTLCAQIAARLRVRRGGNARRARFVEYCDQPAKNLKLVLRTRSAYRFGSRPYVTDCSAQRPHHMRANCGAVADAAGQKYAGAWLNTAINPPKT